MTAEKTYKTNTESRAKVVPYMDVDRLSMLLSRAEKMRAGSWKDFFRKH